MNDKPAITMHLRLLLYIFILCLLHPILSCTESKSEKGKTIAAVNQWYQLQTQYSLISIDSVLKFAVLIDSAAKDLPNPFKAMALVGKGRYYSSKSPELAFKYNNQALALLNNSGADSISARAYNGLGIYYIKKSDYPNALDNYFKALRLFEKAKDEKGMGGVLANIGEVFQVKNDVASAKKYILQGMEISRKASETYAYLDAAHTMANIYGMNNQFDSAIAIDRMGIAVSDSIGSKRLKSSFYNNLGNCYLYSNRPDSARFYFNQCLQLDSATGNWHYMIDNYLTLGQLSLKQQEFAKAEQLISRAIFLSDSVREYQLKLPAWKALGAVYTAQKDFVRANAAKDSAAVTKDKLINQQSENKILELKELYETEKKEQTITMQQLRLSRQQLFISGGVVLLALMVLSGWLFYRRFKMQKEKELQTKLMQQREQATVEILQAEDQERKRIAAELHDGVGQVMLAAWLNLQAIEPELNTLTPGHQASLSKAIRMVGEGCKEVREVSHSMMAKALVNSNLKTALTEFAKQIDRSVLAITLHFDGTEQPTGTIEDSILYRVVQECINNALKHAAATEIDINVAFNNVGTSILIEDNGTGFNYNLATATASPSGLGIQNIKTRIAFLNGKVEWDSSIGNGTVVSIFVPAKQEVKN
ncbi:MAG: tetratricopeptide repeat protein [Chitinophagaceae bacterium]|nr:MAG: tetratricopeptide repeat protein [Chitinophagaceae bacterium]